MKKYVKPELEMKKFVSNETIAAQTLEQFLKDNNIESGVGITTYAITSAGANYVGSEIITY